MSAIVEEPKNYVDLKNFGDRKPLFFNKAKTNLDKFYNAKHLLSKKREGTFCIGFDKTPAKFEKYNFRAGHMRKSMSNQSLLSKINPEPVGEKFRNKALTKTIDMKKGLNRSLNSVSEQPLWMQKKNGSRMTLNGLDEKSQEQSNYKSKSFYENFDSFSPKKNLDKKKKKEIEKMDYENYIQQIFMM